MLLQSGKNSGLASSLGGSFDTYMGKNKASSADARLARLTKWVALVFMLAVLVLNLV
ncbi:MAG: preprotein translocase subunit SecG [Clostridiales bacterium]|nr:preprotein translocase subunit SecG [Clostridiales bacterium]